VKERILIQRKKYLKRFYRDLTNVGGGVDMEGVGQLEEQK